MSSMMPGPGGPPPSISIGGPDAGPGPSGPDSSGSVTDKLKSALKLVLAAAEQEGDDQDTAQIHDIAAKLSKAIAADQALTDQALGAGPGAKLVRKASSGAGPMGGY